MNVFKKRLCAAGVLFLLAFGLLMFYLQYEGITKYEYVTASGPDEVFTVSDAADSRIPEIVSEYQNARMNHVLTLTPKREVGIVRLVYDDLSGKRIAASVSYVPQEGGERSEERIRLNQDGKNEIILSFPPVECEKLYVTVSHVDKLQSIELYHEGAYRDETRVVPRRLNLAIAVLFSLLLACVFLASDVDLRSGKHLGLTFLQILLEIAVLRYALRTRSYEMYSMTIEIIVYGLFALATVVMCMVYRMLFVHHAPMHRVFIPCALTMGIIMMLVIQPCCAPDELVHFYQAYIFSSDALREAYEEGQYPIRAEDDGFLRRNYMETTLQIKYDKYVYLLCDANLLRSVDGVEHFACSRVTSVPLGYVASGLGITLARVLNLSGMALYYMGRLFNLLAFVAMMALVIYWIPHGKAAVLCLTIAPVCMQQAASYSYDGIVIAFAFMYAAYVLHLYEQKDAITVGQYVGCLVLALLLAPSKMVYIPLVLMILMIPVRKYGFGRRKWLMPLLVLVASCAALLVIQLGNVAEAASGGAVAWAENAVRYDLKYLLANIRETINIYLRDFEVHSVNYFRYFFCENLGWHQLHAYGWLTALFCVLFFLGCQTKEGEAAAAGCAWIRRGLLLLLIGVTMLAQLSMLVGWTPKGTPYIEGVQGRYLIPGLILLVPVFRISRLSLPSRAYDWCALAAFWTSLYAVASILMFMP